MTPVQFGTVQPHFAHKPVSFGQQYQPAFGNKPAVQFGNQPARDTFVKFSGCCG